MIYFDEQGAVCRCLNWREAQRTMLTEETKDAVFIIEAINEEQASRAREAMLELHTKIGKYFGVSGKISYLIATNPILEAE